MRPARLLAPRSVAVVGASTRPGSYGNQAVANLVTAGFPGPVYGVHPTAREVHGVSCVPAIGDLPIAPDALVIATPAATVPDLLRQAGERGCGGAVVLAAGFAEIPEGRALQDDLRRIALAHDLPVCGPNGNGVVSVVGRAPMWGDAYAPKRPGPVALVSQSGNVAVNALLSRRALRLHTVVSCGNQAVLNASDYLAALAELDGVRSVALYLETEDPGLPAALALAAGHDIRVAVLKAGSSERGAAAASAHTGAVAGDHRVLRALVEEAGGAWARNPHELLELAKALSWDGSVRRRPRPRGAGVLVVTCSGGDAAIAADEAARLKVPLPALGTVTVDRLNGLLPGTATAANPLDYTALIFGETRRTADIITTAGDDPSVGVVLACYDRPEEMDAAQTEAWDAALDGITDAAADLDVPIVVAATLPELMPEATAEHLTDLGVVPVAGLTEGLVCAHAMTARPDLGRLREIADWQAAHLVLLSDQGLPHPGRGASQRSSGPGGAPGRAPQGPWLREVEGKACLRAHGVAVPRGAVAADPEEAAALLEELGTVVVKVDSADVRHKAAEGGVILGVSTREDLDRALRQVPPPVLIEEMVPQGVEVMISVRYDAVTPVVVVALGGAWVEVFDDAAVVPLPVTAERVAEAVHHLRAARLVPDVRTLARTAVAIADMTRREGFALVEVNPVILRGRTATAVDAVICRGRPAGP
ncbi:acetate--CoA ligase family protein [Herbidospora sp. NBRC 101105]|uniref:acetate--CoA ligase family protein n=1 Tax=Herbidospora sp. NBRC 101105 TaxID=3032195 RepID=UPI0024A5A55F|nr:acetate--CoA ligase family protein [Herbidospora sp. NBRC 101105]GLX94181.1 acyl-CoA synthetase [Herbidospora sp. NBRC 101105]